MKRLAVLLGLPTVGAVSMIFGHPLQAFVVAVEHAKKDGKTVDQAAADLKLPEKYKDYKLGAARGGVTAIYSELK